jgi:4-hydroxybenzoate polyprenyltransferase
VDHGGDTERRPLSALRGLALACHLPPSLAVTAVATVLALDVGRGRSSIWVALAVLAGQLSVGWSNDALDASRDERAQRASKPIVAGLVSRRVVGLSAFGALLAAVPLSLASGWRAAVVHLVALSLAWSYNLGLKATWASVVPYGIAFALLPAFVTLGLPGSPWPKAVVMVVAGLLGVGAHFLNTIADAADDELTGVRGLPQRLGPRASLRAGVGIMALAALGIGALVVADAGADHHGLLTAVLVAAALGVDLVVLRAASRGRERVAWYGALGSAGLCVLAFVTVGSSALLAVS